MITGQVMTNVESASPSISMQREILLAAIKEAVKINYSLLQTFASILCKFTANFKIGTAILQDYSECIATIMHWRFIFLLDKYFPEEFVL